MSKQLLVRNVPPDICLWIDQQRNHHNMSQQEVVLSILEKAIESDIELKLPLFSGQPQIVEKTISQSLPFTFIDLFAGIGGFRAALEKLGGRCRFSCEWDKYSQRTYEAWYGDVPHGDIRKIKIADIPNHDVFAAGFPCGRLKAAKPRDGPRLQMRDPGKSFLSTRHHNRGEAPGRAFAGEREEPEVARQGSYVAGYTGVSR